MRRDAVVAEARRWIGTPFRHQQRTRGAGVDCVGLVIGVGIVCGVMDFTDAKWAPFKGYSRRPHPRQLPNFCSVFLTRVATPADASIGIVDLRAGLTLHLVMRATLPDGRPSIIHATEESKRVVEHGFTAEWPGMIASWWDFPGVE